MTRRFALSILMLLVVTSMAASAPALEVGRVSATAVNSMPSIYDIDFADAAHGWAVGVGHIDTQNHIGGKAVATTDGGATWSFQTMPAGTSILWAVAAGSASNVVAVGDSGTIISTKDGGKTWTKAAGIPAETLRGVACAGSGVFVAVSSADSKGVVYRSTDGGTTWTRTLKADVKGLRAVAFSGANGIAGGYGKGLRTTDSGASWALTEDMNTVYELAYVGATAWSFGSVHWTYGTLFNWSTNQFTAFNTGYGWTYVPPGATVVRASVKPGAGWAVGGTGTGAYSGPSVVFGSTSPATSWTPVTTPLAGGAWAVYCQDASNVILAGTVNYVAKIIRSTDGGKTWKDATLSTAVVPVVKKSAYLSAPTVAPGTPSRTKSFKISGMMLPGMSGSVSVRVYKKGSSTVYTKKTVPLVKRSGSSTYSWILKLPKGSWRAVTYYAGSAAYKAGTSAAKSFAVK